MLSTKEVNEIAKSISEMTKEIKMSGKEMKDALDMSGLNLSVEKYAQTLQNDVNKQFDAMFGKQEKLLNIEERRAKIIKEMGLAIRTGNKSQEDSLKNLMKNFEQMQFIKNQNQSNGLDKARGAMSLAQGVLPYMGGASRAMNMGQGAMSFMGNNAPSLGAVAKFGIPLAAGAYGVSRMMSGYQTYKNQASDVLSGYGKFGRAGYDELDNFGSTQGFSSLERARLSNQLSVGPRTGTSGADVGSMVGANVNNVEFLARAFGMDTSAVGGMVNQVEQIQGQGGANATKMMSEAVAAGVNRSRMSEFMEKSLHLTEQVYQGSGKSGSGVNSMLAQIIKNSGDKEFAMRYGAQAVGQMGESIRSVGMGGGDLATQGFLSRAFADRSGGQTKHLSLFKQMERAQGGASADNISSVMDQLDREFQNDDQKKMVMSQMFGLNFKQSETLIGGMKGGKLSPEEIKKQMDTMKEENFIENSQEGKLFKSIADATNMQAKIGEKMLPLASKMVDLQTHMDSGLFSILDFLDIEDKYKKEKRQDLQVAGGTSNALADLEIKAKYGGKKERDAFESMRALEIGDDEFGANMNSLNNVEGYGLGLLDQMGGIQGAANKRISGLSKANGLARYKMNRNRIQGAASEQMNPFQGRLKDYVGNLREQMSSEESTPEMQNKIAAMLEKLSSAAEKMGLSIDTFTKKSTEKNQEDYGNAIKDAVKAGSVKFAANMSISTTAVGSK